MLCLAFDGMIVIRPLRKVNIYHEFDKKFSIFTKQDWKSLCAMNKEYAIYCKVQNEVIYYI